MTQVRELFQVPETIGKLDYVLQLTSGIEHPEQTAGLYVVTPGLADAFDRSLALVGRAIRDGRSQAAYLHGSFGSGKSHFMAMLSLMLSGQEAAWRLPELHPLREKHDFVGQKKLLQLHFHMVGRNSIEEAIFTEYVKFVERQHPNATVPGVFADEKLFDDARRMLEELGDEAFFRPMNADAQADAGWGEFGSASWDRDRFDAAVASTDVKERERLFSALVKTRFQAYAQESRAFVAMDDGLSVIARHAKDLGYDALVLFLDELILWLSHGAANAGWLHGEVQKMVKLVETQEAARAIPFVSFIARQRNLADMVGEQYAGAEVARLNDSLKHWEGRYDTIALEDRNLPEIISRRVLRPKDEAAAATIAATFEQLQKSTGKAAWNTLLGQEDAQAFRKTYPFSPALIEALVALSSFLQRERTAIRVLMEMLYEHINDLPLGEVVRVGDLFDLLAGGADAVDGVMRSRVEAAKQLYKFQFLPVIQKANGTDNEEKCQRLRAAHPTRLGCANCPQKACRTDNRLATTLLIAALVPEVKSLKGLTASRLVQLNHGSIRVPIEGTEAGLVGQKLKRWVSETISQLRVGDQPDPTVGVVLEGVDVAPILEAARMADKPMERQRLIRDLLFDALGVDKVIDWGKDHTVSWRSTQRLGHLRFGNVRKMPDEQLRCPDDHDWRLVVDYPFDEPGFGPNHDLARLDTFVEAGSGTWTLVWLPHFLSQSSNKLLGELVILEHILESKENERRYLAHLSVENQARAHLDLDNLRNQKRARLRQILEQAYGLARREEETLDPGAMVDTQLRVLRPGARVQSTLAANLGDALNAYVEALLEARYPRHPAFTKPLTARRADDMVAAFNQLVESDAKRVPADRDLRDQVAGTLGVLGLVRTTENAIFLREDDLLQELERKRAQKGLDEVSAGELRSFIDDGRNMGLQTPAQDLVIRCYARWANRTFVSLGKPYTPSARQRIPDEVVLEKPELPSQDAWSKALTKAGAAFGITLGGRALHADHLKEFEEKLRAALEERAGACAKLPGALGRRSMELGLPADTDRMRTAKCADKLCAELVGQPVVDQVQRLDDAELQTGDRAVGRSFGSVLKTVEILNDDLTFGAFDQLRARAGSIVGGTELLEQVAATLRQDEVIVSLADRIRTLALEAMRLLRPPQGEPPPKPSGEVLYSVQLTGAGDAARKALEDALSELDKASKALRTEIEIAGSIEIRSRKPR